MQFAKEAPSLVIAIESTEAQINKSIESREQLSGRLVSDPNANALQKALVGGRTITSAHEDIKKGDAENAVENCLKDTHGEQFSPDADKEMVAYLTKIDKVDLHQVPHCDGTQMPSGFPVVAPGISVQRSNTAVEDALEVVCKSFPKPMKAHAGKVTFPKQKDPVQIKQEKQQKKEAGIKTSKSLSEVVLEVCKSGF